MAEMTVYLDLDGVLCDTITEMFRRFGRGKTPKLMEGSYDTSTVLGIPDPWSQFGADFFDLADWTPDGRDILAAVEEVAGKENICICTTPTYEPDSAAGKLRWIRKNLPEYQRRYVLTREKWRLARPNSILIDDCEEVCRSFRDDAGQRQSWERGRTILVPRPWNPLHRFIGDIPLYVRTHLVALLKGNL